MILDFDSTEASEGSVSVYNGHGDINSSHPAIRLALWGWLASAGVRPGGRLLVFYTFYATYTIYALIFCAYR